MIKYLKKHWPGLLITIVITQLVGLVSKWLSGDMETFYNALIKPPLAPPDWLFGVMWPLLYLLMAIAAYLVYASDAERDDRNSALLTYAVQLAINLLWSVTFFGLQMTGTAIIVIVALIIVVIRTMVLFGRADRRAMLLLVPYLLWLLFAAYLNIGIYILNK